MQRLLRIRDLNGADLDLMVYPEAGEVDLWVFPPDGSYAGLMVNLSEEDRRRLAEGLRNASGLIEVARAKVEAESVKAPPSR